MSTNQEVPPQPAEPNRRPGDTAGKQTSANLTVDSYEGGSRLYTIAIVTAGALWLILVEAEHGLFNDQKEDEIVVTEHFILNFFLLVVWAVFDGILVFLALLPNLKYQKGDNSAYLKACVVIAFISLIVMNGATGFLVYRSHQQFISRYHNVRKHDRDPDLDHGNSISKEGHLYIIVATVLSLLFADMEFICKVWKRYIGSIKEFLSGVSHAQDFVSGRVAIFNANATSQVFRWEKSASECICSFAGSVRTSCKRMLTKCKESGKDCISMLSGTLKSFKPETTQGLLQTLWKWVKEYVNRRWNSIKEESRYKHSGWMLSAVVTSGIVLIYMYFRLAGFWQYLVKSSYEPYRMCVSEHPALVREILLGRGFGDYEFIHSFVFPGWPSDGTSTADLFFSLGQFFNTTNREVAEHSGDEYKNCMLPAYLKQLFAEVEARLEASEYQDALQGSDCDDLIPGANADCAKNDPINSFKYSFFGLFIIYVDAVVITSRWTMYIGFGFGLILGMNSLISVLAQYKSLSLTLTDGVIDDMPRPADIHNYRKKQRRAIERLQKLQLQHTKWSELIKVYPLNSTVIFFGILLSTAVLQLVITGTFFTWVISTLAAWPQLYMLMHKVFSFIIAWIVIALVDNYVMQEWMVEKVLTDNYRFKHPDTWILYTLVYTMLNLVVGILYAVWRLFLLIVLSLTRLTRLDRSLLPTMQRLDQGHNAFFAMVLMHYTIQRNSRTLRKPPDKRRMDLLRRRSQPPNGQGSPSVNNGNMIREVRSLGSQVRPVMTTGSDAPPGAFSSPSFMSNLHFAGIRSPDSSFIVNGRKVDQSVQTCSRRSMELMSLAESDEDEDAKVPLIKAAEVPSPRSFFRWLVTRRREFVRRNESLDAAAQAMDDAVLGNAIPVEPLRTACSALSLNVHPLLEQETPRNLPASGGQPAPGGHADDHVPSPTSRPLMKAPSDLTSTRKSICKDGNFTLSNRSIQISTPRIPRYPVDRGTSPHPAGSAGVSFTSTVESIFRDGNFSISNRSIPISTPRMARRPVERGTTPHVTSTAVGSSGSEAHQLYMDNPLTENMLHRELSLADHVWPAPDPSQNQFQQAVATASFEDSLQAWDSEEFLAEEALFGSNQSGSGPLGQSSNELLSNIQVTEIPPGTNPPTSVPPP